MNTKENIGIEDLEVCSKEGRVPRPGQKIKVRLDDDRIVINEESSVTLGRDLLKQFKREPVENYLLFQLLKDGMLEEIRLDETVNLKRLGVSRFLSFKSDRSFRFELDGRRLKWRAAVISGIALKKLAGVDLAQYGVWIEVQGQEDRPISNSELVDLQGEGLERFYTGIGETTAGEDSIALPSKDDSYLQNCGIKFELADHDGYKAVILKNFKLPNQKFNFGEADILILLPSSYPDCPPDMFYTQPWLKLSKTNTYARAADQQFQFNNQTWQRWSRHNNDWRPGVDGIRVMLQRVKNALENAS